MKIYEKLVIDFKELAHVSVTCPHCNTTMILDAGNQKSELPGTCPSCRREYVVSSAAFESYKQVFKVLTGGATPTIRVHIALERKPMEMPGIPNVGQKPYWAKTVTERLKEEYKGLSKLRGMT